MIHNYRAFGLALVAMLAVAAFVAQAASASPLTVEVPQGSTVHLTGNQESTHKFTTPNGSLSCTGTSFDATEVAGAGGAINELTVAPTMTGCSAFGFATAHVNTTGCTYTFTTPTSLGAGQVTWGPSQFHIVCPAGVTGIDITVTSLGVSICTMWIEPQTPTSGHVVGKNVAGSSPMDVTLEFTLSGIHYHGSGGVCGDNTTHVDATYTGNSTWRCYKNVAHTEQVGCTFS